jgi:addiction module RelE/StbE family toxin
MVEIRWIDEVKTDLKEIFDYIALDSKKYAFRQVEKIISKTQLIKKLIRSGKVVEEINNPDVRELIEGNFRIIYRIIDLKTVDILMVHHSARNLKNRI